MATPIKSGQALNRSLGKRSSPSFQDSIRSLEGKMLSGRIVDINQTGTGENGYATIQILNEVEFNGGNIIQNVLPLFPNLKNYPLLNETVLVIGLANKEYKDNFNNLTYYYLSPLNLWNSNQSNPLPYPTNTVTPETQNRGYLEVEATNNPNKPSSGSNTTLTPGTYFNENNIPNPTYPFEGDYIIDGRFGNSLRLGNTVPNGITLVENNWSTTGSIGDPITILTNQKHKEQPSFNSITENINLDGSSIYLTSTQKLPITVSSINDYLSYSTSPEERIQQSKQRSAANREFKGDIATTIEGPTTPNQYAGQQIILNSGRLLLNTTQDHILLSSQKSINLNSVESVNIDAANRTVIQTPELYLGGVQTAQPVILGDDLVELLTDILNDLGTLTKSLKNQIGVPTGSPLGPTNLIAQTLNAKIGGYKTRLLSSLSQTTKTV